SRSRTVAPRVPQPAVKPRDRVAGIIPGSRCRLLDGARRESKLEALRPNYGRSLRPGDAWRKKRRTGGAKSGAAEGRGYLRGIARLGCKSRVGRGLCECMRNEEYSRKRSK